MNLHGRHMPWHPRISSRRSMRASITAPRPARPTITLYGSHMRRQCNTSRSVMCERALGRLTTTVQCPDVGWHRNSSKQQQQYMAKGERVANVIGPPCGQIITQAGLPSTGGKRSSSITASDPSLAAFAGRDRPTQRPETLVYRDEVVLRRTEPVTLDLPAFCSSVFPIQ